MPQRLPSRPAARHQLDAATLVAARRGEAWAQRAFVRCFQGAVHRLCSRVLDPAGRSNQVEDVTQDAMLRIVRALPGYVEDGPAKLSTWVLTIATRTAIDELRRRAPMSAIVEVATLFGDDRADLVAERRMLAAAIAAAIADLSPEMRAAFVLRAAHTVT